MHILSTYIAGIILGATTVAAMADKLPKGATPLPSDEVRAIYSGKTGVYSVSDVYYDPNGTTKGVFGKPKAKSTFQGTWAVKGNEHCMYNKSKGDPKTYTDCNAFWRAGNKIYSLWTVHYDGSKPDKVNEYWTGALKQHKKGDLVSKKYAAMGGE
ncbi:DUF995 domain-containing protein [Mesorhizobium sp.]|uniref:DUF995 domain-containing protein n=1 Tax=Mesorhizobium sp. TaxID=1871066 RepID=UPI0025FD3371|nr:DUF995 domain-containing protein [Mesorhizobium sp.]